MFLYDFSTFVSYVYIKIYIYGYVYILAMYKDPTGNEKSGFMTKTPTSTVVPGK